MAIYQNKKTKLYSIRGKYKDRNGNFINYERYTGKKGVKSKKEAERLDREFKQNMESLEKNDHSPNMLFEEVQELYFREAKDYLKATTLYKDGKLMRNVYVK